MIRRFASVFILVLALAPLTLSAATVEELQAQITELIAQINALQAKIAAASQGGAGTSESGAACFDGKRNLRRGVNGDDVRELQRFLKSEGFFKEELTGFFGKVTEYAVQRWQERNRVITYGSADTTGYGAVGPKTRAAMSCAARSKAKAEQTEQPEDAGGASIGRNCLAGSVAIAHGASYQFFSRDKALPGETCLDLQRTRTCSDGKLTGEASYQYTSCSQDTSCSVGGIKLSDGQSGTFYAYASVVTGESCASYEETRTCNAGVLSGDQRYAHTFCVVKKESLEGLFDQPNNLGFTPPASGASCKSASGDRPPGTTLSEQLITGATAGNNTTLPWYICNDAVWHCTTFCAVDGQKLWQESGTWKSNGPLVSQTGPTTNPTDPNGGIWTPLPNSAKCIYKGTDYPHGLITEGKDVNNLCLGPDLMLCIGSSAFAQFQCKNGTWVPSAVTNWNLPSPTTFNGDCTPAQQGCHFCIAGNYGFWTMAPKCPEENG